MSYDSEVDKEGETVSRGEGAREGDGVGVVVLVAFAAASNS